MSSTHDNALLPVCFACMAEYCSYPGAWTSHPEALRLHCDRGTLPSGVSDLLSGIAPPPASFRARPPLPPPRPYEQASPLHALDGDHAHHRA